MARHRPIKRHERTSIGFSISKPGQRGEISDIGESFSESAVKDFIRAQVERRWNLNESAATAHNWTVSIRIALDHNGRVLTAEIVDDPRFRDNDAYRDFAHSARNAVLLSSPLLLPDSAYDLAKDIVVDFDPRQVSR